MTSLPIQSEQEAEAEIKARRFVERIQAEFKKPDTDWRTVAKILAESVEEFGHGSIATKYISKATQLSRSKISKLISIHHCERLRKNSDLVSAVASWTTLYEITRLSDCEFEKLLGNVAVGEPLTGEQVKAVKHGSREPSQTFKAIISVQVDVNALKARRFDGEDYERLLTGLKKLQKKNEFVRIEETGLMEKDEKKLESEIVQKYKKIARAKWKVEKTKYIANSSISKADKRELNEDIESFVSEGEYEKAFAYIGSDEFDPSELFKTAVEEVLKDRDQDHSEKNIESSAIEVDSTEETEWSDFDKQLQDKRKRSNLNLTKQHSKTKGSTNEFE